MRTQVQYSPHDSIVLVAHTGLFVELASRHAAPHVREQQTRLIACSPMHSTPQPYAPRLQVYALHAATMCAHAAPLCVPRCASSSPVSSAHSRRGRWRRARWHGSRSTSTRLTLTLSLSLILTLSLTSHPNRNLTLTLTLTRFALDLEQSTSQPVTNVALLNDDLHAYGRGGERERRASWAERRASNTSPPVLADEGGALDASPEGRGTSPA